MTILPKNIDHPCYHDDDAARIALEAIFWPQGPACPHCGKIDTVSVLGGKSMGPGWYWCAECREKFTVRVGSVLERSHIPLHKWMLGFRFYASSKKGFSAHQLMRTLGLGSYRSAWFMAHRIREAMDGSTDNDSGPLGGEGKIVEADETYFGTSKRAEHTFVNGIGWVRTRRAEKMKIMTLVERGGRARSVKVENLTSDTLRGVLVVNASRKSILHTDDFSAYQVPGREFARHETVNHSAEEYSRRTPEGRKVTTNTVEGFFSIFKRGMIGVYQHCSEKHLSRYLSEFDFRYSNRIKLGVDDTERTERAIKGAVGRRLTYRQPDRRASA
jgi:transposase-like protein